MHMKNYRRKNWNQCYGKIQEIVEKTKIDGGKIDKN